METQKHERTKKANQLARRIFSWMKANRVRLKHGTYGRRVWRDERIDLQVQACGCVLFVAAGGAAEVRPATLLAARAKRRAWFKSSGDTLEEGAQPPPTMRDVLQARLQAWGLTAQDVDLLEDGFEGTCLSRPRDTSDPFFKLGERLAERADREERLLYRRRDRRLAAVR